jgi:hypothetical protein
MSETSDRSVGLPPEFAQRLARPPVTRAGVWISTFQWQVGGYLTLPFFDAPSDEACRGTRRSLAPEFRTERNGSGGTPPRRCTFEIKGCQTDNWIHESHGSDYCLNSC